MTPTELPPLLTVKSAIGRGTLDSDGKVPLEVISIEFIGQRLDDESDEVWYNATIVLGSDAARELIKQLAPIASAIPTPFEQLAVRVSTPTSEGEI